MQSLQYGVPVIARNIPGNVDIIKNNFNGYLFNNEIEMINYIKKIYYNKKLKDKLSNNASKSINNSYLQSSINEKIYKLIKKFQNKIFFSRVNLKILNKVISFINSHSKADLDKNFYKSRYLFNRRFYSFICKINDNIIGHVGFYKYPIKNKKKNIYSRHSSVVHKNFRNQKIYSKLVEYSIKYLNNLDSLILWPNKNNLKVKIKSLKTIFTYKINNELIFFKYKNKIKLKKLDKLSILNKYYKSNTFKNIFSKDKNFFHGNV